MNTILETNKDQTGRKKLTKIITSFILRYGLSIFLTLGIYNSLNSYPPLSWFDKDQRTISNLTNNNISLEKTIKELVDKKSILTVKIAEQNSAMIRLKEFSDIKIASNIELSDKLNQELNDLNQDLNQKDANINSCQDAINYMIGINDD